MTVTTQRSNQAGTAELTALLEQAHGLATAAGRGDLVERLASARSHVSARPLRVAVVGAPGQGVTSLVQLLQRMPAERPAGASFAGAPGRLRSGRIWIPEPGTADAVLFVAEAHHEYSMAELEALGRIRSRGMAVAGVLTKFDLHPDWAQVQQADRQRLRAAGLDSPPIALLPVSSALCDMGWQRGDDSLVVASGVPQLLEHLRERVSAPVAPAAWRTVLAEVRAVADQLSASWSQQLDELHADGVPPRERQRRTMAELERRQQLSANWQIALNDGMTELVARSDFDLRDRLRVVLEATDKRIAQEQLTRDWDRFDAGLRGQVDRAVRESYQQADLRGARLSEVIAAAMAGRADGGRTGIALPDVRLADPGDPLGRVTAMEAPDQGGVFARVVNSLRGSYSGILMVGVLTSLAGQQLISVYSVAAGVLMGLFTFWEDVKNRKERAAVETRMAVAKLLDGATFHTGDDLRTQLRAVHRTLRDHFTAINDQRLRAAADAARAAAEAAALDDTQLEAQVTELRGRLAEARQLRARTG